MACAWCTAACCASAAYLRVALSPATLGGASGCGCRCWSVHQQPAFPSPLPFPVGAGAGSRSGGGRYPVAHPDQAGKRAAAQNQACWWCGRLACSWQPAWLRSLACPPAPVAHIIAAHAGSCPAHPSEATSAWPPAAAAQATPTSARCCEAVLAAAGPAVQLEAEALPDWLQLVQLVQRVREAEHMVQLVQRLESASLEQKAVRLVLALCSE